MRISLLVRSIVNLVYNLMRSSSVGIMWWCLLLCDNIDPALKSEDVVPGGKTFFQNVECKIHDCTLREHLSFLFLVSFFFRFLFFYHKLTTVA